MVCGILFKPIERLLAPYLGLLWEKYKPEYPECREVAPLTPVKEAFGSRDEVQIQFSDIPPLSRVWFMHVEGNGIIQVQRDRFLHNWKKARPDDEYPRYHSVIDMFRDRLSSFESFLEENKLGVVEPIQYEMTYVNHIPQGDGWTTMNEIGAVFPDFAFREEQRFLPEPEGINWRTTFVLPDHAGRLYVTIRRVVRRDSELPMLLLELTVRGIGEDKSRQGMREWFDLARQWIVCGFADLTGQEVQKSVWKRIK